MEIIMEEDLKASLEWLKDCAENEYIFETGDSKLLLDYITNLQEENEMLTNARYSIDRIELERRIDKAIEYINNFWKKKSYYEDIDNCMKYATINEFDKADLLNILQGEDKE